MRLLYAAIADVGESVRANDAKASAAIVLHGLVFAGITTLLTAQRRYRRVFFPVGGILDTTSPHREMCRRLDRMGELDVRDELVAEVLKLVAILNHESHQTKWGYRLLRVELASAAAFFVVVAVSSL